MNAMKRLNRLMLLGLLALLGSFGATASAQSSMRIGSTVDGATFLVDGQRYTSTQLFTWPEGSTHSVQFPANLDLEGKTVQYFSGGGRYRFDGWAAVQQAPLSASFAGTTVSVVASPKFTELIAQVQTEFRVRLSFTQNYQVPYCAQSIPPEISGTIDVPGAVYFDGACTNSAQEFWFPRSSHTIQVFNYPGYVFHGVLDDTGIHPMPMNFTFEVRGPLEYTFLFAPSKRVRFSTYPAGLELLVDRNPIVPKYVYEFLLTSENNFGLGSCPPFQTIPLGVPFSIAPLCIGDFDFAPGSQHVLGARPVQRDANNVDWVFDHFSNGLGQNGVYTTPGTVSQPDDIQAVFVRGVQTSIRSNFPSLKISVDGDNTWSGPVLYALWGVGQKHRLSVPDTMRDSAGRLYRFVSWSDGGDREHDVTVPANTDAFNLTATWELLGQVQVSSTPVGLTLKVDGNTCTTPCTFDKKVGQTMSIEAPQKITVDTTGRYDLDGWSGHPGPATQQVTFTGDVLTYNAVYHGSHTITASTNPAGGAKFTYSPSSPDGFFPDGTAVHVSLKENPGFKFIKWGGDLSTRSLEEDVVVNGPISILGYMEVVPIILPGGVRNAAGDNPFHTVAPGSLISIFGEGLTDELLIGPTNPLSQAIGQTYVTVDDAYLLPLMFISPKQINAQLPSSVSNGEHTITVHTGGKPDLAQKFTVARNAPGIFFNVTKSGMPLIAALHEDGTPITETSPAVRGETITFYGTGYGAYDLPAIDGFPLPKTYTYKLIDAVHVLAGAPQPPAADAPADPVATDAPADPASDAAATVVVPDPVVRDPVSATGATGMVGISVIRWKLDDKLPAGSVLEISASSNNLPSNKVQLPVK